jgi:hypothetical protein
MKHVKHVIIADIARDYLEQFLEKEQPIYRRFQDALDIEAIHDALVQFKVIRCIPGNGKERFSPIIVFLNEANSEEHPIILVRKFHELLRQQYGKTMISAASKLMWLRRRGNIIIIDKFAKKSLGLPSNVDYAVFATEWKRGYKTFKPKILKVIKNIENNQNKHIVQSEWYFKRCFDLYLWTIGSRGQTLNGLDSRRKAL